MSIAIGDPVSGGTAHSILFVGPGTVLAQDNTNFKWNTTDKTLLVNGAGAKSGSFTAVNAGSNATSSTSGAIKTALSVTSIGTWNGTNAENRALYARASGGPADANYAGFFDEGDVVLKQGRLGAQVLKPSARIHAAAGSAGPGTAAFKLNPGAKLTTPEVGAIEFDGEYAFITRSDGTRRLLTNNFANIIEFGANDNGTFDNQAAFQAAVNSLAHIDPEEEDGNGPGGVIWVPTEGVFGIGSKVSIVSRSPIWIMSAMAGKILGGGAGTTYANGAQIRPLNNMDYMFEWDAPAAEYIEGGGGGIQGLHVADMVTDTNGIVLSLKAKRLTAAVHVLNADFFHIYDCFFQTLKGSAIQFAETVHTRFWNLRINSCGDSDVRPALDLAGPTGYVWGQRLFMEGNSFGDYPDVLTMAPAVRVNTGCILDVDSCYFENDNSSKAVTNAANNGSGLIRITAPSHGLSTGNFVYIHSVGGTTEANGVWQITVIDTNTFDLQASTFVNPYTSGGKAVPNGRLLNDQVFLDATDGGTVRISNGWFNANELTSVILGKRSLLTNCSFENAPSGNPTIKVLAAAEESQLHHLDIRAAGVTGITLDIQADHCIIDNVYMKFTGRVDVSGTECTLSNISMFQPTAADNNFAIDLAAGNYLHNAVIDGNSASVCDGIGAAGSFVSGCVVRDLNNGDGIVSADVATANFVTNLNGGTAFKWAQGAVAKGNKGYPTTATTDTSLVATLHAESGEVTTTSISTAPGAFFTVTLLNNLINANSRVMVRLKEGTNTQYPIPLRGSEFNGGVWITGDNASGSALDGSVKIQFDVTN